MNQQQLYTHYEKIYFHELQRKEQVFSRLNIPLAVMVAIVGFYAILISSEYRILALGMKIWFWVILSISIAFLVAGSCYFVDALLGKMDKAIATPNDIEKWRQELIIYYKDETDCTSFVSEDISRQLYIDYMDCSSILTINNDRKSSSLYYCNMLLISATVFAAASYAIVKYPTL